MTFQQLQYLLEVSRIGSISGAAKNLFLAQSSISAAIHNLEEELGFPIFLRTKKGVIPTVQGAEAIERAAYIWESYQGMKKPCDNPKRHLSISAPAIESLDEAFAQWIAQITKSEALTVSSHFFSTAEAIQKLASFELDLALLLNHKARFLSVETMLRSKNLAWEALATLPAVIQIGPSHSLYHKKEILPEDLEQFLFVDLMDDPLLHNEYLKGEIRLSPEKTVSVKSPHAAHLLVARGLCFSLGVGAPRAVSRDYGFRTIPLKNVSYTLTAVTNPKRQTEKEIQSYLSLVKERLSRG